MSFSCHDIFEAANSHTNQQSNRGTTRGRLYPTTRHGSGEWCTRMLQKKTKVSNQEDGNRSHKQLNTSESSEYPLTFHVSN